MSKAWTARMRREGRCIDCGQFTDGCSRCQPCRKKYAWTPAKKRAQVRMAEKRRLHGQCARCRAESKRFYYCLSCRLYFAKRWAAFRERLAHAA